MWSLVNVSIGFVSIIDRYIVEDSSDVSRLLWDSSELRHPVMQGDFAAFFILVCCICPNY